MKKTLVDILADQGLLPEKKVQEYMRQAKDSGLNVFRSDDSKEPASGIFPRSLAKLINLIESERAIDPKKSERVKTVLEDLAFFSTYRFEFLERELPVFREALCTHILYRILIMKSPSDVLKLLPEKRYFEENISFFQKLFLLSHIRFFSTQYVESLEADPLFEEFYNSPYLREFLFLYETKGKKYYIYDRECLIKAAKFGSRFSTVFEALHILESHLAAYKKMLDSPDSNLKKDPKKQGGELSSLVLRTTRFLENLRELIHNLAANGGGEYKFKHLALCLLFATEIILSIHKTHSFETSRLVFLQNFIDFKSGNPVQIEITDEADQGRSISFSYLDALEFAVDVESLVTKAVKEYIEGRFMIRFREKTSEDSPWSKPQLFLEIPKKGGVLLKRPEEYVRSGGINLDAWEKYKKKELNERHPAKKALDAIFKARRVTKSYKDIKEAGFSVREEQTNGLLTCTHPEIEGYFIDLALDSYIGMKAPKKFRLAVERMGALSEEIRKKGLENTFAIAQMWSYLLPQSPPASWWLEGDQKILALVRQNLGELSFRNNLEHWKGDIDLNIMKDLFRFAFETGLRLEMNKLHFTKDEKIVISPYSQFNNSRLSMLTFAKHLRQESFQSYRELIDKLYSR